MSPAHGSARLLMASTAARGCLLHLAVPFHLLFWKACFGGDPGINSLCEANDFQKCMTGFFVGSPPPLHVLLSLEGDCTSACVGWEKCSWRIQINGEDVEPPVYI